MRPVRGARDDRRSPVAAPWSSLPLQLEGPATRSPERPDSTMQRFVKPLGIGLVIAGFIVRSQGC
ncbi:hypothetical protein Pla163_16520 [Planctomycetes bacterium Pla163]|uniref:Uncharacterized protein n=1 Tax=Rohdeia mirabilis TaxID=2528008 RepID=A0A518CZ92_9BACT|nr:hypothetical protein Pla163_16520 [Planctomycetes bacterium Pla163]